mmetsp:Transcript_28577/g.89036  ORF Transcript_28577/g.89036 Transcript_28577/m.89036 type:complete len:225 (-) Transcript_28577:66-740(-)
MRRSIRSFSMCFCFCAMAARAALARSPSALASSTSFTPVLLLSSATSARRTDLRKTSKARFLSSSSAAEFCKGSAPAPQASAAAGAGAAGSGAAGDAAAGAGPVAAAGAALAAAAGAVLALAAGAPTAAAAWLPAASPARGPRMKTRPSLAAAWAAWLRLPKDFTSIPISSSRVATSCRSFWTLASRPLMARSAPEPLGEATAGEAEEAAAPPEVGKPSCSRCQ